MILVFAVDLQFNSGMFEYTLSLSSYMAVMFITNSIYTVSGAIVHGWLKYIVNKSTLFYVDVWDYLFFKVGVNVRIW